MQKLIAVLFIFLSIPYVTLAQNDPAALAAKQRRAGQVADRFVNRFRETLDFGIAWKAFRLSDPSCTHRANGNLNDSDYKRLTLSSRTIEKLYIATMNLYYLMAVYELSLVRIDSQVDSDSPAPREVEVIQKKSKFFQNDDRTPQNVEEVRELINTFDQLAAQYRKHMPKRTMKSPAWRANQKYLSERGGMDHAGVLNGLDTACVPEQTKVSTVDRGLFYFYIVEERGNMRVAGLGID